MIDRPGRFRFTTAALACCMLALLAAGLAPTARAQSGKLLLTGGVTQVEGAAGGGLVPWAVIGGYGTRDEIGANAFYTVAHSKDYRLDSAGALVGVRDRVELSFARQAFDTRSAGGALGLGNGFTFGQDVFGLKVKIAGDAVLEQDTWLPQIAVGVQHKHNDQGNVVKLVGAKRASDQDFYVAATKLYLAHSLLVNGAVRWTRANQLGLLGYGGDRNDAYRAQFEGSIALLLSKRIAVGAEYRMKPDNLGFAKENDWWDLFVAWAPNKHVSLTAAWARLGDIATFKRQDALYLSAQIGF